MGVAPHQISPFLARHRRVRRVPLDDGADLAAAVAREGSGCYVLATLRHDKKASVAAAAAATAPLPVPVPLLVPLPSEKTILKRLPPTDLASLVAAAPPAMFGGWDYDEQLRELHRRAAKTELCSPPRPCSVPDRWYQRQRADQLRRRLRQLVAMVRTVADAPPLRDASLHELRAEALRRQRVLHDVDAAARRNSDRAAAGWRLRLVGSLSLLLRGGSEEVRLAEAVDDLERLAAGDIATFLKLHRLMNEGVVVPGPAPDPAGAANNRKPSVELRHHQQQLVVVPPSQSRNHTTAANAPHLAELALPSLARSSSGSGRGGEQADQRLRRWLAAVHASIPQASPREKNHLCS